jgi:hypothetical protein
VPNRPPRPSSTFSSLAPAPARRWFDYVRDGWELGGAALAVAARDRNLRRFAAPAYGAVLAIEIAGAVLVVVLRHDVTLVERIVFGLVSVYLVALASNLAAVGLAGLADRVLDNAATRPSDGWRLMRQRLPQVAGWALLLVIVGIPARLFTGWGLDQLAAVLLGFGWAVLSFFAVPAIALAGDGPLRAAARSAHLVGRQWGRQVVGMVYVWLRPVAFVGLPGALATALGVAVALGGHDLLGWSIAAGGVVAMAVAYLLVVTASSVLSVTLYRYAEGRPLPSGFDPEHLERVLRAPAPATVRVVRRLEGRRLRHLRERLHERISQTADRDSRPRDVRD